MKTLVQRLIALLSSYGLSCSVLFLLGVLTWLGTLAQIDMGLYAAQKKYFDSWWLVHLTGVVVAGREIGIPLPGGQLLLWVLCANLLVGGLVRLHKNKRTIGILITHVGIAVMLLASFVKYYHSDDGHLTLYEGERCDEFQSYFKWEIAIAKDLGNGRVREYVIPGSDFVDMRAGETRRFSRDDLPFDLVLSHFMPNGALMPKGPMFSVAVPVVDGFYLAPRPPSATAENNIACAYATLRDKTSGSEDTGILFGYPLTPSTAGSNPWVVARDDGRWSVDLRHERYPLPFTVHLDEFMFSYHPRTGIASNYESKTTLIEAGDVVRAVAIRMNEPLRDAGHVLFQSGFGPPGVRPDDNERKYSVFSVVRNPSDKWPEISCYIIALGLLIHFGMKLGKYARAQQGSAA